NVESKYPARGLHRGPSPCLHRCGDGGSLECTVVCESPSDLPWLLLQTKSRSAAAGRTNRANLALKLRTRGQPSPTVWATQSIRSGVFHSAFSPQMRAGTLP